MGDSEKKLTVRFDVSIRTLLKIFTFLAVIGLVFYLRDVIIALFVAVILMSAITPFVEFLKNRLGLPTLWAITIAYLITITLITGLLYLVVPPLLKQLSGFFIDLPRYAVITLSSIGITESDQQMNVYRDNILPLFTEKAGQVAAGVFGVTIQLFSGIIEAITVAVFTFYLLLERSEVEGSVIKSLPFIKNRHRRKYKLLFEEVQTRLGHWARGQAILCVIIGLATYVGLLILAVPYALPLAVIAGILEMVPTIGPIISAIPAAIIIVAIDPSRLFFVLALYLVIQQLENSLIVPQIMKKAVGFSPLLTIVAIMIGGKLLGVWGALLAIPFTVVLFVILQNYKKIESSVQTEE